MKQMTEELRAELKACGQGYETYDVFPFDEKFVPKDVRETILEALVLIGWVIPGETVPANLLECGRIALKSLSTPQAIGERILNGFSGNPPLRT